MTIAFKFTFINEYGDRKEERFDLFEVINEHQGFNLKRLIDDFKKDGYELEKKGLSTGYTDSHGKILYEGDKVMLFNGDIGIIQFHNGCFYIKNIIGEKKWRIRISDIVTKNTISTIC